MDESSESVKEGAGEKHEAGDKHIEALPDSCTLVNLGERKIYLVGTAHVSKKSVEDVHKVIEYVHPDTVCVELCDKRYQSYTNKKQWSETDVFRVVKEKKALFLLAQMIMSSFYRQLGERFGVTPGAEMFEAIKCADDCGAEKVMADRNIDITLRRVWGYLKFSHKMKMAANLMASLFIREDIDEETIEKMKTRDQMEFMLEEFSNAFPEIRRRLIDERDIYLAQKIRRSRGKRVVAVVGAGHVSGIKQNLGEERDLKELEEIPRASVIPKIIGWSIPVLIIGLFVYGFIAKGAEQSVESIKVWVLANGIASAGSVMLALAHPVTVIAAFVAAPLTSLNPMIAAGWVAGLVQAVVQKPLVSDLEALSEIKITIKSLWRNRAVRVLLVVVFANLGSTIGTALGAWLVARGLI